MAATGEVESPFSVLETELITIRSCR